MIALKNGTEIEFNEDFDVFFETLLQNIVRESRKKAQDIYYNSEKDTPFNDLFLKEIMDNAIFITHQLFEMSKKNRQFSEFVITGFLFNSIILSLSKLDNDEPDTGGDDSGIIH